MLVIQCTTGRLPDVYQALDVLASAFQLSQQLAANKQQAIGPVSSIAWKMFGQINSRNKS